MADEPGPCLELHEQTLIGMELVGTVPLPSPFPASARLYVVRYPGSPPASGAPAAGKGAKPPEPPPRFLLKLVETINHNHVITRLIDPAQVRAVQWIPDPASEKAGRPVLHPGSELRAAIKAIDWSKAVKDPDNSYECPLSPDQSAVVHVAESAPVVLRHEQTVPAAVSLAASPALAAAACPHKK